MKAHEAFMDIWLPSKMAALARQISQRQISDTFLLWKESEKYIFNPRHTAIWARANKYNQPTLFGAVHSAVNYTRPFRAFQALKSGSVLAVADIVFTP